MADSNNEKDLIGSILSDDEVSPTNARPQFQQIEKSLSNISALSTGNQSAPKGRMFFKSQTSIEMSMPVSGHQESDKYPSMEQLQQQAFQVIQTKHPHKKHYTIQPQYPQEKLQYKSDKKIDSGLLIDSEQLIGNQPLNRKLQNILEYGTLEQKQCIFNKVIKNSLKMSKDMFGNYTIQKLFELGLYEWKYELFCQLESHFGELALHSYGCRVVQKVLEFVQDQHDMQEYFLSLMNFKVLTQDQYGNFVILSCFETIHKNRLEFLIPMIEENVQFMSKQTHGCRVLQKILELYSFEMTQGVFYRIMQVAKQLCFQEFGNYIIQFILRFGPPRERMVICDIIKDNFESLSMNKYGSNTVEKYLDQVGPNQVVGELLKQSNNEFVFFNLAIHPFGNYVMKKVLMYDTPIRQLIKSQPEIIARIKQSEYGTRIASMLECL